MAITYRCVLASGGGTIPNGKTVTPTDDIQTWLNCGGIFHKSYTTLSEILNDSYSLMFLIGEPNAVDYMVRSTTWVSDIVADSNAMKMIGGNDYCSITLLANSTWRNAICNSTYFESVLNVKVPQMTSNTSPSGEAFASSAYNATYAAWKAFDRNKTASGYYWSTASGQITNQYLGYIFNKTVGIYKVEITNADTAGRNVKDFVVQYKDSNNTWVSNTDSTFENPSTIVVTSSYILLPDATSNSWRIFIQSNHGDSSEINVFELQFYGRAITL